MLAPDARLARIAERQHSVFTHAQALACGFTTATIRYRLQSGRWRRLHRGIYVLPGVARTFEQKTMGAVLAAGPSALASHRTAGALFQLEGIGRGAIEVVVGLDRRVRISGVGAHQTRTLRRTDRTKIVGIPVTTPARTLIDLASVLPDDPLEDAVHDAIRRGLVRPRPLEERLARMQRRGCTGTARLLSLVRGQTKVSVAGSGRENRLRRALVKAGLEAPVRQHVIYDARSAFVARVDLAYPDARIYIEFDGAGHSDPRQWRADLVRQNRLSELGWLPLRFTEAELKLPASVLASKVINARRSSVDG